MNTPETDKRVWSDHSEGILYDVVEASFARKLERERDEAQKELSLIHRWIERNHADGVIDSLTYLQNLERVTDSWYDRFDGIERERDEAREEINRYREKLDLLPISWDV
jgi:hypothetical protein